MRRSDVQRRTAPHGGHRFPAVASGTGSWQLAAGHLTRTTRITSVDP